MKMKKRLVAFALIGALLAIALMAVDVSPPRIPLLPPRFIYDGALRFVAGLHRVMLEIGPPELTILWVGTGFMTSSGIRAACQLRLPEVIPRDGAMTSAAIASAAGLPAGADVRVRRLLRALASIRVFEERTQDTFSHTHLSHALREDDASMCVFISSLAGAQARGMTELAHSVRTGEPAFEEGSFWVHCANLEGCRKEFDEGLASFSRISDEAVSVDYPAFQEVNMLVDLGGGSGSLARRLLCMYPHLNVTILDQPATVARGTAASKDPKLPACAKEERLKWRAGDFFKAEDIPKNKPLYMLKQIIHDWSDDEAVRLLKGSQPYVQAQGAAFVDLMMLSNFGGSERTEKDFRRILERAGFQVRRVIPTRSAYSVIEATPSDREIDL